MFRSNITVISRESEDSLLAELTNLTNSLDNTSSSELQFDPIANNVTLAASVPNSSTSTTSSPVTTTPSNEEGKE